MYLFIFESIGMQELMLIGAIALIIFGPRKLPQMAKTIGKTMNEFRRATSEFKETWEREATFEDDPVEVQKTQLVENTIAKKNELKSSKDEETKTIASPEIREISGEELEKLKSQGEIALEDKLSEVPETSKQNWL